MQYQLDIPAREDFSCQVLKFEGHMALSSLYEFQIECLSKKSLHEGLSKQSAILTLIHSNGQTKTQIPGLIKAVDYPVGPENNGPYFLYQINLVSPLSLLSLEKKSRVYVNRSLEDILFELIKPYPSIQLKLSLLSTLRVAKREMVVQEEESDFSLLDRLLASYQCVYQCRLLDNVIVLEVFQAKAGQYYPKISETYLVQEPLTDNGLSDVEPVQTLVGNEESSGFSWLKAISKASHLCLGQCIELNAYHPTLKPDWHQKKYRLTQIKAKGSVSRRGLAEATDWVADYVNELTLTPLEEDYYPQRPWNPNPAIGFYLATIEALPNGQHLDEQGYYRIRFPFDDKNEAGMSSKPIASLQPMAYDKSGMHFPLKAGTVVVIAYEKGDRDQPVIIGVLPALNQPTPHSDLEPWVHHIKTYSGLSWSMSDDKSEPFIQLSTHQKQNRIHLDGKETMPQIDIISEQGDIRVSSGEAHKQKAESFKQVTHELNEEVESSDRHFIVEEGSLRVQAKEEGQLSSNEDTHLEASKDILLQAKGDILIENQEQMSLLVEDEAKISAKTIQLKVTGNLNLTGGELNISIGGSNVKAADGALKVNSQKLILQAPLVLTP